MAIPTQFSVTSTRSSPIANPLLPQDPPQVIDAENTSIVDGAEVLASLSSASVDTPSTLTSESSVTIPLPSELTARVQAAIDNAVTIPAEAQAGIDTPSAASAESAATIDNASALPAENAATIGTPTAASVLPSAPIDAPEFTVIDAIQWDFNDSLLGWTANNATLSTGATFIEAQMTGADFQLIKDGLADGPREQHLLWVKIKCTSATVNTAVRAFTRNSAHGYSNDYSVISNSIELPQDTYVDVYLNLAEIQDFYENGLTELRIDPFEGALQTFEIDRVWLGSYSAQIPAREIGLVPAPSAVRAESAQPVDNASALPAQSSASIDTPVAKSAIPAASIDAPSAATSESVAPIATPSTLTTATGTPTTPPFALNHARILWRNKLEAFQTVAQSEGVGLNAIKPNTWEKWRFDSAASNSAVLITLNNPLSIDTICIGAHNLGDINATVSITYSVDGVAFVDWEPDFAVTSNAPVMRHITTPRSVKALQITITIGATGLGEIGFISAGEALQMQRPFFNGHTPITDGDATQYYSNRTESGEIIGQQIRRQGFETSADWQNIDDTWYRTFFAPFKQSAKLRPFFFAWNLLEYPNDVGFCRISQDISAPMQNGTVTKRSISMNLLGAG